MSADLLLARRVIDGLVRGTDAAWNTIDAGFVKWAVAVIRTHLGPQLRHWLSALVAGFMFLLRCLFRPRHGWRHNDPALPWSWASGFLGWRRPADLLTAHAVRCPTEYLGLCSALVTTAEGPRPSGWSGFRDGDDAVDSAFAGVCARARWCPSASVGDD